MSVKNIVQAIPLSSIASTSVSGTYAAINATGLPNACILLKIVNNSDVDVTVSYDGAHDHDFVPTKTSVTYNFQTGSQPNNYVCCLPVGTKVYVKGSAGMSGSIYLVGFYQPSIS